MVSGPGDRPRAEWVTVDVDRWVEDAGRIQDEPLGTKTKFWVRGPDGAQWLFKAARVDADRTVGEDWSEWLVCRLAGVLGVPAALVEPATHTGRRGIVSRSVLSPGTRLDHGNELLQRVDPAFDASRRRHNPPSGHPELEGQTAFDVWAAYLLLDAWVAGRDRHPRNWAVQDGEGTRSLAPSFDHGNALGFQETEDRQARLVADPDRLLRWARKGVSPHFSSRPRLTTLAGEAASVSSPPAARYWRRKVVAVDTEQVVDLVGRVPESILSEAGRSFCRALLDLNRRRVLDGD